MKVKILLVTISVLIIVIFNLTAWANPSDVYDKKSWQSWKQEYDLTLTRKGGWLSLVGLYWMTEGDNSLGSAKNNRHMFPKKAPASIGSINIQGEQLTFTTQNKSVKVDSSFNSESKLSVSERTVVSFGDFEFYIIKREKGFAIRLIDNASEQVKAFTKTSYLPFDPKWVIKAKLVADPKPTVLKIPTVYGTIREEQSGGWLEFAIEGKVQRLQAVNYGKDTPLYVMFSDSTSGYTTYGAGRYIEVEWPDNNGITVIDFNRSYNPPCAFTNFATCPLTPRQNRLKVAINAGELYQVSY